MSDLYRKKPVVIEAIHWDGTNVAQAIEFIGPDRCRLRAGDKDILISTLEGTMAASPGDWIIKGVRGELYPCKSDIFEATYEKVEVDDEQ